MRKKRSHTFHQPTIGYLAPLPAMDSPVLSSCDIDAAAKPLPDCTSPPSPDQPEPEQEQDFTFYLRSRKLQLAGGATSQSTSRDGQLIPSPGPLPLFFFGRFGFLPRR
ncbi:hypothetical protein GGTG_13630 [Gaeumannomyces tritici R3-111a-1]|uniref:Uncharacterized protein n=1 Tax=Gaeumannomyces tritici (strain R3-111a-1) TaxID=644352 RepID=J3PJF0_GAET3|nr:hypothetical protein GGTG_13630 [Gaeumannomyces tritici R3-111a-1]EJT68800.1 hypothetical protein GGTG_13630 [Gaeumannomyces tritici R3-111a-1]